MLNLTGLLSENSKSLFVREANKTRPLRDHIEVQLPGKENKRQNICNKKIYLLEAIQIRVQSIPLR